MDSLRSKIAFSFIAFFVVGILFLGPTAFTLTETANKIEMGSLPEAEPAAAPPAMEKYAVLIGIVYPDNKLGRINYADVDAGSIYDYLVQYKGYKPENIIILQNNSATRENILQSLQLLAENPDIDSNSEVVFFYSGHGLRNGDGVGLDEPEAQKGYALVPYDYENFDYEKGQGLIWDSEIASYLSQIEPGRMWVSIDSCFSGGFNQPGITGQNRVVTLSSRADQLSGEIDELQRGVMTELLFEEGIKRGLSVEESYTRLNPGTSIEFKQDPLIIDDYEGDLVLQ